MAPPGTRHRSRRSLAAGCAGVSHVSPPSVLRNSPAPVPQAMSVPASVTSTSYRLRRDLQRPLQLCPTLATVDRLQHEAAATHGPTFLRTGERDPEHGIALRLRMAPGVGEVGGA
jgi:hypothetical protein